MSSQHLGLSYPDGPHERRRARAVHGGVRGVGSVDTPDGVPQYWVEQVRGRGVVAKDGGSA